MDACCLNWDICGAGGERRRVMGNQIAGERHDTLSYQPLQSSSYGAKTRDERHSPNGPLPFSPTMPWQEASLGYRWLRAALSPQAERAFRRQR